MNKSSTINKNKGFSLIELSIVLIIMAVLIGLITFSVQTRMDAAKEALTKERMKLIMASIDAYYAQYGVIPCPAVPVERTDANYGWSQNPVFDSGFTYAFDVGNLSSGKVCIYGGDVPFKVLGLDATTIADGWGNRFYYVPIPEYTIIGHNYSNVGTASMINGGFNFVTNDVFAAYAISSAGANGLVARNDKTNILSTNTSGTTFGEFSIGNSQQHSAENISSPTYSYDDIGAGRFFVSRLNPNVDIIGDDIVMWKPQFALPKFTGCDLYKNSAPNYYDIIADCDSK